MPARLDLKPIAEHVDIDAAARHIGLACRLRPAPCRAFACWGQASPSLGTRIARRRSSGQSRRPSRSSRSKPCVLDCVAWTKASGASWKKACGWLDC